MSLRRYAEGTTVDAERTQAEMRSLLAYHKADGFALASDKGGDAMQFVLAGRRYQFNVRRPIFADVRRYFPPGTRLSGAEMVEREWKRLWRARLLWLRSTLEFAASEGSGTVAHSLAAFLVLPDGRTTLGEAIDSNNVPLLAAGR